MHGIVFTEFQHFIERGSHEGRWHDVLHGAKLDRRVYASIRHYPDKEFFDIVGSASRALNKPVDEIVEDFGVYIAPDLLGMYAVLIKPGWRTLDVIEHTEAVIHSVVRVKESGAEPPQLKSRRVAPDEIELIYDSPRKLCRLAKGIIRGIAAHFGERIQIVEHGCMLVGASSCKLQIRRLSP
jgi:predicted hydrocarbon binding protein